MSNETLYPVAKKTGNTLVIARTGDFFEVYGGAAERPLDRKELAQLRDNLTEILDMTAAKEKKAVAPEPKPERVAIVENGKLVAIGEKPGKSTKPTAKPKKRKKVDG